MSAKETDKPAAGKERRKYKRRHVLWQAKLQCGRYEFDCWVYNMSLDGANIRFDLPIAEDCGVVLSIKDVGVISGRVVWSVSGLMGIDFISSEDKIRKLLGDDVDHFAQIASDSD